MGEGKLQEMMGSLSALTIEGSDKESPVAQAGQSRYNLRSQVDLAPVEGIKRSDTSDSLNTLIGKSPSLAHLEDISFLPSPVAPDRFITSLDQQVSDNVETQIASPRLKRVAGGSIVNSKANNRREPHGLFPPKLFERLQKEHHSLRTTSLNAQQEVNKIEMPRMVRHHSQTQVDVEDPSLHREAHRAASQLHEDYGTQPNHTVKLIPDEEVFQITCEGRQESYSTVKSLGEGTFSRVVLAKSTNGAKDFVAIKIVDLALSLQEEQARVAMTVCREIELLQKISSPLIVKLRGSLVTRDYAQIVLDYCAGGDLFSLASDHRSLLTVALTRRIFAEVVCAVRTLHHHNVAHRDLKLENVLLKYSSYTLKEFSSSSPLLTTLTDLGLAREFDPDHPDLTTRCGSEDYAAPELIMGQSYDGRQTDAWALGVILYSMLEGRLPFDVIPGLEHRMKSKVLHRICRIEWRWVLLKDAGTYNSAWDGAKRIVTNLLRSRTKRWSVDAIAEDAWLAEEVEVVERLIKNAY